MFSIRLESRLDIGFSPICPVQKHPWPGFTPAFAGKPGSTWSGLASAIVPGDMINISVRPIIEAPHARPQISSQAQESRRRALLVLDLGTLHGDPAVEAIYGISQKLERLYAGEFAITPEDGIAYRVSGLARATKFDMSHSVFLPYNDVWFDVPPGALHGQTPKLGLLHPSLMHRAQAAYAARRKR